jgi:hypothetical protein
MEKLLSSKQDSLPNQYFHEENTHSNPTGIKEQTFFLKAFELIKTLTINFSEEPAELTIFKFIQISVNFWNKVISSPQNEEMKYSMETFDEKSDEFVHIINQQQAKIFQNSVSLEE